MQLTKSQLQRIIKEEIQNILNEQIGRPAAERKAARLQKFAKKLAKEREAVGAGPKKGTVGPTRAEKTSMLADCLEEKYGCDKHRKLYPLKCLENRMHAERNAGFYWRGAAHGVSHQFYSKCFPCENPPWPVFDDKTKLFKIKKCAAGRHLYSWVDDQGPKAAKKAVVRKTN